MGSKAREGAKTMSLEFVLLDYQHAGVAFMKKHNNKQTKNRVFMISAPLP